MNFFTALVLGGIAVHARSDTVPDPAKTGGLDLADPAVVARGIDVLNKACGGYCHGTNGGGFKAPSLRNRHDLAIDGLHATISYGRKRAGKMMPGWKGVIPEEDIWSAVAAIVSLRDAPRPEKPAGGGSH